MTDIVTTPAELYAWLGARIALRVPGTNKVLRAPINRASIPIGSYAIFQMVGMSRAMHRPYRTVNPTTGIITEFQSMRQTVQVDFFGNTADDMSRAFFADIMSPYQSEQWRQAGFGVAGPFERVSFNSFVNDERQLEERWLVRFDILYLQAYAQTNDAFTAIVPILYEVDGDPNPPPPIP